MEFPWSNTPSMSQSTVRGNLFIISTLESHAGLVGVTPIKILSSTSPHDHHDAYPDLVATYRHQIHVAMSWPEAHSGTRLRPRRCELRHIEERG